MPNVPRENVLAHHGVKGMKWGVRRDASGGSKPRGAIRRGVTKANTALEAGRKVIDDGEKKLIFLPQAHRNAAASATQKQVLGVAAVLNRDPKYKGKDLKRDDALKTAYYNDVKKQAVKIYEKELANARGEALKDFVQGTLDRRAERLDLSAPRNRVRHADDNSEVLLTLVFSKNNFGQISDVSIADDNVSHSDAILQHHGVKGMKWGVRRNSVDSGPVDVTVSAKPGQRVRTSGGQHQPASDDAVRIAASRQKARSSTTDSLSNKELKDLVNRMQMEQQYGQLMASRNQSALAKGHRAVKELLGVGNTANQVVSFHNSPVGKSLRNSLRK